MWLRRSLIAGCSAISCMVSVTLAAPAQAVNLPLMPWPQRVEQPASGGSLTLTPQLTLQITGDHLAGAEARWLERIGNQTGWPLLPARQPVTQPTIRIVIAHAVDPLLIARRTDPTAAAAIRQQLQRWQANTAQVMPVLNANALLKPLAPSAQQVAALSRMGIELVNAYVRNQAFGASEVAQMHATLDAAAEVQDETVIALVRPLETLLRAFK